MWSPSPQASCHTVRERERDREKIIINKIEKQGDTFYLVSSIESGNRFSAVKLRYLCYEAALPLTQILCGRKSLTEEVAMLVSEKSLMEEGTCSQHSRDLNWLLCLILSCQFGADKCFKHSHKWVTFFQFNGVKESTGQNISSFFAALAPPPRAI